MSYSELRNLWRTFPLEHQRKVHELVCEFRLDPTLERAGRVWLLLGERRYFDRNVSNAVWDLLLDRINEEIANELRKAG